jgi:hypothetical protein
MENNVQIFTRDEMTQIRLSLKSNITELKRMIEVCKQYKLDYTNTEEQLINSEKALEKFYGAASVIATKY